jgi:hypothetical protein
MKTKKSSNKQERLSDKPFVIQKLNFKLKFD